MSMIIKNTDYDDSDKVIWESVYLLAYENKIIGTNFDIGNVMESKRRKRIVAKAKEDDNLEIGGETDFNFSSKTGIHKQSKYDIYKNILKSINDKNKKIEAIKLLEDCKNKTHKIENFSLLLCNGSLQTLKGTLDKDRIDVFLYLLDNYYRGKDMVILSHCAPNYEEKLKKYLNLFIESNPKESIYKYCDEVYHIGDRNLVKDLIKSGKKTITTPERVVEYMKLAIRFWECKSLYYKLANIKIEN